MANNSGHSQKTERFIQIQRVHLSADRERVRELSNFISKSRAHKPSKHCKRPNYLVKKLMVEYGGRGKCRKYLKSVIGIIKIRSQLIDKTESSKSSTAVDQ